MSVNTVSVVGPRSKPQQEKEQKPDVWDQLLRGLKIAEATTGVAVNYQNFNKLRAENSILDDKKNGGLTSGDKADLFAKGAQEVPVGSPGSQGFSFREGEGDLTPRAFIMPKKEEKVQGSIKEVKGAKGPMFAFVTEQNAGQYEPYIAPKEPKEDKTPGNAAELRKEYNSNPTTKQTYGVVENYNRIKQNIENPNPTGASDMSLVYSFMKMNDPGSTVREGEFATAENSGGISDKLRNVYNKMLNGERLTPEQRQNFASEAEGLMGAQLKAQEGVDKRYADISTKFGLDPGYVVEPSFGESRKSLSSAKKSISAKQNPGEAFAAPMSLPKAGVEEDGYVFQGGDPGDPKNWKKK